jgi:hypothetical protein
MSKHCRGNNNPGQGTRSIRCNVYEDGEIRLKAEMEVEKRREKAIHDLDIRQADMRHSDLKPRY